MLPDMPEMARDRRWWKIKPGKDEAEGERCGRMAWAAGQHFATRTDRRSMLRAFGEMYADKPVTAALPFQYIRERKTLHNVMASMTDAWHARIAKSLPRPWVVTQDGDWDLYQRSKAMSLWTEGEFERLDVPKLGPDTVQDTAIYGTGCVKVYDREHRPCIESVWCGDLHVDPREERNRCVRTLYQTSFVDKDVLREEFPRKENEIHGSGTGSLDDMGTVEGEEHGMDQVLVIEAWRLLPEGKVRHVICVERGILHDEEYEDDWFPFVFMRYARVPGSFWGQGLIERLIGVQSELNAQSEAISDAHRKWFPAIAVKAGSVLKKFTNDIWSIIEYAGDREPVFINPLAAAADVTMREDALIRYAAHDHGFSELNIRSEKPPGVSSGVALNNLRDNESERFSANGREYDRFVVDLAKRLHRCAERIVAASDSKEHKLTTMGGEDALRAVSFTDAQMKRDAYRMRVFPVSALSSTPAGRLQDVANMLELGLITDRDEALEMLNMPDVDRYTNERLAARHVVDKRIEATIDGPKVKTVHEHCDLNYAVRWGTLRRDLAEIKGAPDRVLDRLDAWISHAVKLRDKVEAERAAKMAAAQAAMQPQPAAPAQPPAGPAPMVAA